MRTSRLLPFVLVLGHAVIFSGCGYSREQWDMKVRESDELRSRLATEQRARERAEADYANALEELERLRQKLDERGLHLDAVEANQSAQDATLEEYAQRTQQLTEVRRRWAYSSRVAS